MSGIVPAILAQRQRQAPLAPLLRSLGACDGAVQWAALGQSPAPYGHLCDESAWLACRRADWLLWLAELLGVDRRLVVAAACGCATTVLPLVLEQDREVCAHAIATALQWCDGTATDREVARAADVASVARATHTAAYAAAHAAAYAAAHAAAYAAAYSTANDAYAAAHAAANDANDAYTAAADHHARMADIVRAVIPWWVVADALAEHQGSAA